jgi:NAD(P)-dependent dehydrogenase (short-subunit alcohol dehydrogenase family)
VDASIGWQGHCDLFMSNAGIGLGGAPHLIPQEAWDNILAINLHSHIWAVRRILPHMLERGSGHLVHTASSAGTIGFAQLIPYCVTKFGVVGLCESLAGYVHDRGIGVSVICPLVVATNIAERSESYPEEELPEALQEQMRGFMAQVMASGLSPDQVATDVVDAVDGNHLYVLPHPELKDMILQKWADPDAFVRQQSGAYTAQLEMMRNLAQSGSAT